MNIFKILTFKTNFSVMWTFNYIAKLIAGTVLNRKFHLSPNGGCYQVGMVDKEWRFTVLIMCIPSIWNTVNICWVNISNIWKWILKVNNEWMSDIVYSRLFNRYVHIHHLHTDIVKYGYRDDSKIL